MPCVKQIEHGHRQEEDENADQQPFDDHDCVSQSTHQCASSQLCAARASTASGTASESAGIGACSITFWTTGSVAATSASGTSNTSSSCTCSSIWAESLCFASAASIRTIARRMMSAAVPCSRALIAARSLKERIDAFEWAISG